MKAYKNSARMRSFYDLLLPLAHLIDHQLLCEHEECPDKPVDSDSGREEVGGNGDHDGHSPEHDVVHDARVGHERWFRFRVFSVFFLDDLFFQLLQIFYIALFRKGEFDLEPLRSSDHDGEDQSGYSSYRKEMDAEKFGIDAGYVEICKDWVEVVIVREIGDPEHDPVEDYEERHLDKERQTGSERVHLLRFVQGHKLHPELCLVALVFLLEFLDLGLNRLHLLAVGQYMMLGNQKDEAYDERDKDNGKAETVAGKPGNDEGEQIVYRSVKNIPEEGPEEARLFRDGIRVGGFAVRNEAEFVFAGRLEELVKRGKIELFFRSGFDPQSLAELFRRICDEIMIFFDREIAAGIDGRCYCGRVPHLDRGNIRAHVRCGSDMESYLIIRNGSLLRIRENPIEDEERDGEYKEEIQEAGVHVRG